MYDQKTRFYIPYGEGEQHAKKLKAGLQKMVPEFTAELCGICKGQGSFDQLYTLGCGYGTSRMNGECEYCNGLGLMQNDKPVGFSVVNQVLEAACVTFMSLLKWSIQVDYDARDDRGKKVRSRTVFQTEAESLPKAYDKAKTLSQIYENVKLGACLPGHHMRIP